MRIYLLPNFPSGKCCECPGTVYNLGVRRDNQMKQKQFLIVGNWPMRGNISFTTVIAEGRENYYIICCGNNMI